MKVIRYPEQQLEDQGAVVLAIGFFDGVHLGHRAVLEEAVRRAREAGGEAWVMTFDPHPLSVINPSSAPRLLTSADHKCRLFEELGLDGCILMSFDRAMQQRSPEDFFHLLTEQIPGLLRIVVGRNWTFGSGHRGDTALLRSLAETRGIRISVVPQVISGDGSISSTRIREAVLMGDLEQARAWLGRPFSIFGQVVHGHKIGRELGYPTANVKPHNEVHLPDGIYAARAKLDGETYPGAAYVGCRPTFQGTAWVVEIFLLDQRFDLYGRDMEIQFLHKVRDDRAFSDAAALRAQITLDIETVRRLIAQQGCAAREADPR
ncbi:MAG: bifunctional riboflavin kinase/FAD synthetase [Kiritimatiellae bacterium]|nr:bifunctional riboflavin kinase/FAD synthetase [Kiritimatiellia bacterium]